MSLPAQLKSILISVLFSLMPLAHAADPAAARAELDRFVRGLSTLTGRFEQRVYNADAVETERATGTLALAQPRQFRWDYQDPYAQQIVADGTHVWIYDVDLEQASVRPQSFDEASSPIAVLLDLGQLDQDYRINGLDAEDGRHWLRLVPRAKDADFRHADFGFREASLERLVLTDSFGQRTELRFSAWVRNPELPAGHFKMRLPEGVDVIGAQVESAEVTPIRD
ncbi:MAG: outer membrane lipoprotein carrier protein LolA [Xanthomonadales bacterium]|jgi:outer membrane lipoprotein carrier protein|nr:outer membrane lipoprotein carrier protein LolA [Xanthomonadales bacterium]